MTRLGKQYSWMGYREPSRREYILEIFVSLGSCIVHPRGVERREARIVV